MIGNKMTKEELNKKFIKFIKLVIKASYEIPELIRLGVDVNCTDKNGDTALFLATRGNNLDLVKLLVERVGVDVNQVIVYEDDGLNDDMANMPEDDRPWTALRLANYFNRKEIAEYLKQHGAS
jgi:ankyrin repeat protein